MLGTRIIQSDLSGSRLIRAVSRGTGQSGPISPVLWLIVIYEIQHILNRHEAKLVAHPDNLVILVSWMLPSVINDILKELWER